MQEHQVIKSKMKKTKVLLSDPILADYVPETRWFSKKQLYQMLAICPSVYVKPDKGRQGLGVLRVKLLSSNHCEIAGKHTTVIVPYEHTYSQLKSLMLPKKKYLLQQGIDLATYNQAPFDIRVVMQKPLDRWQFTITSAKIGDDEHAVTTWSPKGSLELPVEKVLQELDQDIDPMSTYRELIDISHQLVAVLSTHFPLEIVGLDLAVDKQGHIWFIEANTKPNCNGMENFNDTLSYSKYLKAKGKTSAI